MSRLAFFSPLPPAATGIADYAADVLALLSPRHHIDVFHDQADVDRERLPAGMEAHHHGAFTARDAAAPYDLAVYQLGNAPAHDFVYPYLARRPGLLVLHDLALHHARGRWFLESEEARSYARNPSDPQARDRAQRVLADYAAEVSYSYPGAGERVVAAHLGTIGDLLPYAYPLFRLPVEASRVVAVHNAFMAEAVRAEVARAGVVHIPMPVSPVPVRAGDVAALRSRYGVGDDAIVVAAFGLVTREKRIDTIARAVARAQAIDRRLRLMIAGPVPDRAALERRVREIGVAGAIVTGRVAVAELAPHMELADVVVHLRYPTARETSAALLRVLAQGRPTVMADLEHLADVPPSAVVRADVSDEEGEVTRAVLRLAGSQALRARLGAAARDFVAREHSPSRTAAAYDAAIERAAHRSDPAARDWPAHWRTGHPSRNGKSI